MGIPAARRPRTELELRITASNIATGRVAE
jgi:hypothetical protein